MKCTLAFLLVFISLVSSEHTNLHHYTFYKSFPSALEECAEYYEVPTSSVDRIVQESYPSEPEVKQLIRCALINVRCWNDTTGVQEQVMNSFFNPTPQDSEYLVRTRECMQRSEEFSGGNSDLQTRAYDAFICYYRQYGTLNETNQYLPFTEEELYSLMLSVLSIAHVSQEALVQFSDGNVLNNEEFPAVLYIHYVRVGFYQDGLVPEHLYVQFGNPELLTPRTEQCVSAAVNSLPCEADDQKLLYNIFRKCLVDLTSTLELVQKASRQLLGLGPSSGSSTNASCTSTCPPPTSQAPYYNAIPR
ncbi:hypothetical protein RP20_CCG009318 [Aedes albopictus]|nr:hypothetical protein RP20_CCG009318 [Aedes albopictus]